MQLYSSECALDTISGGRSRPYPTWGGVSISCVTSCVSSRRRTTRSREDGDVWLRGAGPAGRPRAAHGRDQQEGRGDEAADDGVRSRGGKKVAGSRGSARRARGSEREAGAEWRGTLEPARRRDPLLPLEGWRSRLRRRRGG